MYFDFRLKLRCFYNEKPTECLTNGGLVNVTYYPKIAFKSSSGVVIGFMLKLSTRI